MFENLKLWITKQYEYVDAILLLEKNTSTYSYFPNVKPFVKQCCFPLSQSPFWLKTHKNLETGMANEKIMPQFCKANQASGPSLKI